MFEAGKALAGNGTLTRSCPAVLLSNTFCRFANQVVPLYLSEVRSGGQIALKFKGTCGAEKGISLLLAVAKHDLP